MLRSAMNTERLISGTALVARIGVAEFVVRHCIGQLMAFWQAAQIIGPEAFPVLLTNAAVPLMFFVAAVTLAIGFKTRFAAITMAVLLAGTSLFAIALSGSIGDGALNGSLRVMVILLSLQLAISGGGRWSVDGLLAARLAVRTAP